MHRSIANYGWRFYINYKPGSERCSERIKTSIVDAFLIVEKSYVRKNYTPYVGLIRTVESQLSGLQISGNVGQPDYTRNSI